MSTSEDFDAFVATQYAALVRTAYLLTQDRDLAEDLVQTTLARCSLKWHRIDPDDPLPHVRRTLITTYLPWWRRRWNTKPEADAPALPKRMRAIIVLRFYEDLTETETAHLLGCSVGTVKTQTARALTKLRILPAKEERA